MITPPKPPTSVFPGARFPRQLCPNHTQSNKAIKPKFCEEENDRFNATTSDFASFSPVLHISNHASNGSVGPISGEGLAAIN
jgi:hypothetical protein